MNIVLLMGAVGHAFAHGDVSGTVAGVAGLAARPDDYRSSEFGARVGYKATGDLTVDAFVPGTTGEEIDTHFIAGAGLRLKF